MVQELAGINNEYVRRAVEETRLEVESAARAEIEAIGDRERSEGAAQAIDRLVALFTDPSALAASQAATRTAPVEAPPTKEPVEEEEPETVAAAEEEEEEEAFSAEPYIDSFLCTSCNDCINLNPQLFRYNEDKQAVIGDVSAGTFLELVKAAEACPAHCIHPGSPAEDDETATPEVIARAKAFQ
jgi:ferredoxin